MDLYEKFGLRRVINANDKTTLLGGARVLPEIAQFVAASLSEPFELAAMQDAAGGRIAEETGAEWGCVTACAAACITLGMAACMTGNDMGRVAQLPDTTGMSNRVVIQKGHSVSFGAPVTQMIRLSGAEVIEVGTANGCRPWHIEHALAKGHVAAIMAVESYHTAGYAGVKLPALAQIAKKAGIPLVVDAATQELRLREIVASGADLIGCSAHKYFGSTTAGVMAGRRDLVEAVKLQHQGIGRPMKAGKEAIIGVLSAFDAPMWRNTESWSRDERRKIARIVQRLDRIPGLTATVSPDPNGCPFDRACLCINPERTGHTALSLQGELLEQDPPIHVRIYNPDDNKIFINATEMTDTEIDTVCERIAAILSTGRLCK
jgi:uncharacterized pyridoxal phosphate-dependent enzyme